jgi:hypothetical protein
MFCRFPKPPSYASRAKRGTAWNIPRFIEAPCRKRPSHQLRRLLGMRGYGVCFKDQACRGIAGPLTGTPQQRCELPMVVSFLFPLRSITSYFGLFPKRRPSITEERGRWWLFAQVGLFIHPVRVLPAPLAASLRAAFGTALELPLKSEGRLGSGRADKFRESSLHPSPLFHSTNPPPPFPPAVTGCMAGSLPWGLEFGMAGWIHHPPVRHWLGGRRCNE